MATDINLCGEIDEWPRKFEMARIMRDAGLKVNVGQYSVRLDNCEHFVFQHYGGDICDPIVEADGSNLEIMTRDARRVSDALTAKNIRHRFELYDDSGEMVGYIHHDWPQAPVA